MQYAINGGVEFTLTKYFSNLFKRMKQTQAPRHVSQAERRKDKFLNTKRKKIVPRNAFSFLSTFCFSPEYSEPSYKDIKFKHSTRVMHTCTYEQKFLTPLQVDFVLFWTCAKFIIFIVFACEYWSFWGFWIVGGSTVVLLVVSRIPSQWV